MDRPKHFQPKKHKKYFVQNVVFVFINGAPLLERTLVFGLAAFVFLGGVFLLASARVASFDLGVGTAVGADAVGAAGAGGGASFILLFIFLDVDVFIDAAAFFKYV